VAAAAVPAVTVVVPAVASVTGAGRGRTAVPHLGQKANSGEQAKPQPGHADASGRPQRGQNAKSAEASRPQAEQFMASPGRG
jgi:hypothetical protein